MAIQVGTMICLVRVSYADRNHPSDLCFRELVRFAARPRGPGTLVRSSRSDARARSPREAQERRESFCSRRKISTSFWQISRLSSYLVPILGERAGELARSEYPSAVGRSVPFGHPLPQASPNEHRPPSPSPSMDPTDSPDEDGLEV